MSMPQTFTAHVSRRAEKERLNQQARINLDTRDDDTGEVTFSEAYTFTRPTEERLFLMATAFGASSRPENAASEVDACLRDILLHNPPKPGAQSHEQELGTGEYLKLRNRLTGPLEQRIPLEFLMDFLGQMVGYWSDFPTQPSSDSSPEQPTTGGRSTGRVHSPVSTPSSFPSDAF
jgi:hypothetical protein